jgi:hypothetical protein
VSAPWWHLRQNHLSTAHPDSDRQANSALYYIAPSRLRWDTRTRDYRARRITEGKSAGSHPLLEALHRAREIYQIITSPAETQPPGA